MGLRSRAVILVAALYFPCLAPVALAGEADGVAGETVYAASNGTHYHRTECPRLRFSQAITRHEAQQRLSPCPVCKPDAVLSPVGAPVAPVATPAPAAVAVAPAATAAASARRVSEPPATEPEGHQVEGRTRHKGLSGALIGAVVGAGLGLVGAGSVKDSGDDYAPSVLWVLPVFGATVGGGVGYFIGKNTHSTEAAFRREQDRFRLAHPPTATLAASPVATGSGANDSSGLPR